LVAVSLFLLTINVKQAVYPCFNGNIAQIKREIPEQGF